MSRSENRYQIAKELRHYAASLRRKPTALADIIPLLQRAADALEAAPPAAQPDERKAFEAWAMTQPRHEGANMRFLGLNNAYIDFDLHGAWLAWQARAAQVEPAPALKERPDFIAGYDAGLADGKRCAERDRVEPAPSPPAAQPEAWVSVEDQLPPANPINDANSQPVLFWGPAFKHGCEFGVLWYRAHGGSWNGSRGYDMNEVTHWLQPTLPLAAAAQEQTK